MPRDAIDFAPISIGRSPSGLFTRRQWERDRAAGGEWPARNVRADDESGFARWVHGEAKTLAAELDRLLEQGPPAPLTRNLRSVVESLWNDAEWARRQLDGSLADAA